MSSQAQGGQKAEELPSEEKSIVDSLTSSFGGKVKVEYVRRNRIKFSVLDPANIVQVAEYARDSLHFDHCANVTGTDFPKDGQIQIDYQLGAVDDERLRRLILTISVRLPYSNQRIPSLIGVYPSVEYHERETYEMIGVEFEGHPELSRLLLPEDWSDIPPMLKKYRLPGRLEGE